MRIGVICSAGGSAFYEVARFCKHIDFIVITDRMCAAEDRCKQLGIPFVRIDEKTNEAFSEKATDVFKNWGNCDFIILFSLRLLTKIFINEFKVFNIHPSLLPAFKGIGAVKKAKEYGVRYFGATLHLVDDSIDGGPIIGQASHPVTLKDTVADLERLSFIHKVTLFFLAIDLYETGNLRVENKRVFLNPEIHSSDKLNPILLNNEYVKYILEIQEKEKIKFL